MFIVQDFNTIQTLYVQVIWGRSARVLRPQRLITIAMQVS